MIEMILTNIYHLQCHKGKSLNLFYHLQSHRTQKDFKIYYQIARSPSYSPKKYNLFHQINNKILLQPILIITMLMVVSVFNMIHLNFITTN